MRFDGALEPQHGAPPALARRYAGAKKYRDKSSDQRHQRQWSQEYKNNKSKCNIYYNNNTKQQTDFCGIRQSRRQQQRHYPQATKARAVVDEVERENEDVDVDVETERESAKNAKDFWNKNNQINEQRRCTGNTHSKSTTKIQLLSVSNDENNQPRIVSGAADNNIRNYVKTASAMALQLQRRHDNRRYAMSPQSLPLLLLRFISSCVNGAAHMVLRVLQPLVATIRRGSSALGGATNTCYRQSECRQAAAVIGVGDFSRRPAFSPLLVMCLLAAVAWLPNPVLGDDGDNFFAVNSFSMGPETTTPEFDYASRGQKKFGDKCDNTLECGFPGSICDPKKKSCQCTEDLPVTNHIDKCGKEAAVNESCFFNEQCEVVYFQTECRDGRCVCRFEMLPIWSKDGTVECKGRQEKRGPETYIDPAMIGVLVGMALMFIIICVVLRLFSQARWRENRTIFNTPNPRLMNVSLLRDSKLLHGQERRGSRMSVRAPSRQPSMASLRPHSPNPSLGKPVDSVLSANTTSGLNSSINVISTARSHSNSHGSGSQASATSVRSTRSNSVAPGIINTNGHHERKSSSHHQHHHQSQQQQHQHHQQQQEPLITNITANPASDSVTVEIIVPENK